MVKNSPAKAGDLRDVDSSPGSGRCPGRGLGNPLQYYCLEHPVVRGAWQATVCKESAKIPGQPKRLSMHTWTSPWVPGRPVLTQCLAHGQGLRDVSLSQGLTGRMASSPGDR